MWKAFLGLKVASKSLHELNSAHLVFAETLFQVSVALHAMALWSSSCTSVHLQVQVHVQLFAPDAVNYCARNELHASLIASIKERKCSNT